MTATAAIARSSPVSPRQSPLVRMRPAWSRAITNGLTFAIQPNMHNGVADLVSDRAPTVANVFNPASLVYSTLVNGLIHSDTSGANNLAYNYGTDIGVRSGDFSVVMGISWANGGTSHFCCGCQAAGVGWGFYPTASGDVLNVVYQGIGVSGSTSGLGNDRFCLIGLTVTTGGNVRMFNNGVSVYNATLSASYNNPATTQAFEVLGPGSGGVEKLSHCYVWNRRLTDDEHIQLFLEPFMILQPVERRIRGFVGTSPPPPPSVTYPKLERFRPRGLIRGLSA